MEKQGLIEAGAVEVDLSKFKAPGKYRLTVSASGVELPNEWEFWVYPAALEQPSVDNIHIADTFDDAARDLLAQGKTILLLPDIRTIRGDIPQCFTSIYWNCPWTDGGESQTLGLLTDPEHPVFEDFPTDSHTNWHWWELLTKARPMILDGWSIEHPWPKAHKPLIQLIDDWNQNRKLAVLAEAKVGPGKLMVCAMDIENDLENRPVARQFRHSLLRYMNSRAFDPQTTLSAEQVEMLFKV